MKLNNLPTKANASAAFTLIEMLVVVTIIGILIAGVFRLMGAAGENNKKAVTVARLQKMQNALSGFYAEYGTYPPVIQHGSPDPYVGANASSGQEEKTGSLIAKNANRAASCQPIAFEYPNRASLNEYINTRFQSDGVINVNEALGPMAATLPKYQWQEVHIFRFGVLSYLLPRVELMGGEDVVRSSGDTPNPNFFKSLQWSKNNSGSLSAQQTRENRAVARWLPNFEGVLYGGYNIMGIQTAEPDHGGPHLVGASTGGFYPIGGGGIKYVLVSITVHDGWGNDLYYYSAPPYQSYRIWSAGPNGSTFPPWISLDSIPSVSDRKLVTTWIDDDIVRFDR